MNSFYYFKKLNNIKTWISYRFWVIIGSLGILILFMILLQIGLRVFFKFSIAWVFELVSIFAVYAAFFGSSLLILEDRTAKVDVLFTIMPRFLQKLFLILEIITKIVMGVSILIGSINYMEILKNYRMNNFPISTRLFAFPIVVFGLTLMLNGFISFLQYIISEKGEH